MVFPANDNLMMRSGRKAQDNLEVEEHQFRDYDTPQGLWSLQWRHNIRDSVSNHQPHDCLLNRLFRRRSKKTSKLRASGLCAGNSPHKCAVTRKRFPFDDVTMWILHWMLSTNKIISHGRVIFSNTTVSTYEKIAHGHEYYFYGLCSIGQTCNSITDCPRLG